MPYVRPRRRKDGFFNLVSPNLPVLAEGKVLDGPDGTLTPPIIGFPIYPEFEVDFYGLPCDVLQQKINGIENLLQTSKFSDPAFVNYYQARLAQARSAWQLNCGASVDPVKEPSIPTPKDGSSTGTGTGGGSATPIGINPTVTLPTGSNITIGPGVAPKGVGGGSGGSSSSKPGKKINWWMWGAIAAVVVALYQTRKD